MCRSPANSFLWPILEHFAREDGHSWPLQGLETVLFHNCCHGGPLPTQRRVVATTALLTKLAARCQGGHHHEPWGFSRHARPAYPPLLATRWADCLKSRATACRLSSQPAADLHAVSLAASARQSRKFQPLLPEFREIRYMPSSFQPDKSCKVLLSHVMSAERESAKVLQVSKARSRSPPSILTRMSGHGLPSTSEADAFPDLPSGAESSSAAIGSPHSEGAVRVGC